MFDGMKPAKSGGVQRVRPLLLALLGLSVCSCVYLRDRGMDFLDQWRVGVGAGTTIGIRYKSLGLIDTGLMVGVKPNASALGWVYGAPFFFNPDYDLDYAPVAGVIGEDNPALYRSINWGEFRAGRAAGDYADYGEEIQISHYRLD